MVNPLEIMPVLTLALMLVLLPLIATGRDAKGCGRMSDDRYFPYPQDPARKIGFIIGDLIALAILLLILLPIFHR
jgi:hypothetical protein